MPSDKSRTDSEQILARLYQLHPRLIDLSLERVSRLLSRLGNPERKLGTVVHVAGTNGKGSVIAFLQSCLAVQGKAVHVYTSPHLVHFHERIVLNGSPIEEAYLSEILDECEQANDGEEITHFEITTAAAFLAFARVPSDIVLLETGLGGRYDATNVVADPALSIITPIDLDHQSFLGTTIAEIAFEKAGILKPNVPAVVGPQPDEARKVLEEVAQKQGVPLSIFGQDWSAHEEHGRFVYQDEQVLFDLNLPNLKGRHQIENAGTAIAALRAMDNVGGVDDLDRGLSSAHWPARLQRLKHGPLLAVLPEGAELWLDGGHNGHAARALASAFADMDDNKENPLYLILGMIESKDPRSYLEAFSGLVRHVTTVPIPGEACISPGTLYDLSRELGIAQ